MFWAINAEMAQKDDTENSCRYRLNPTRGTGKGPGTRKTEPKAYRRISILPNEPQAVIIGSWCGKRFRPERVSRRSGFDGIPAVKSGRLHETKSSIILQPGPAALTKGASAVAAIIRDWRPDHA